MDQYTRTRMEEAQHEHNLRYGRDEPLSMSMNGSRELSGKEEPSEIPRELKVLDKEIARLIGSIEVLEQRLLPAMRHDTSVESDPGEERTTNTELGSNLAGISKLVERAEMRIQDIIRRIQL